MAVEKLLENEGNLKFKITDLKRRLIAEKVNNFNANRNITVEFESDMDIKELQLFADQLYKKAGGIRAVLSETDGGYYFAICGDEKPLSEFFARFKNAFNVKGGGRGNMVQGTVTANRSEIEEIVL